MTSRLVASLCLVAVLAPLDAFANGRFPRANQLVVDPGDPSHIVVRSTFGMLRSIDSGNSWSWTCEQLVGYNATSGADPAIAVMGDGTILAGSNSGLSISHDRSCSWALAGFPLDHQDVIDMTVDSTNTSRALVVRTSKLDGGANSGLVATEDSGRTWKLVGAALPADFLPETVELAASDRERVYLGGSSADGHASVLRSNDGGSSWARTTVDATGNTTAYVAGVLPKNADQFYARTTGGDTDRLWVTLDGGTSWKDIFDAEGGILGFAVSPDGSEVAVGGAADGVQIASTSDNQFRKVSSIGVWCLTWSAEGLYACSTEVNGFSIGRSDDEGAHSRP